eukprot:m.413620 g.413620  ORF g.413620 m.413620 type:complete len:362 (+) comp29136_c0_seq1:68-1153(+)
MYVGDEGRGTQPTRSVDLIFAALRHSISTLTTNHHLRHHVLESVDWFLEPEAESPTIVHICCSAKLHRVADTNVLGVDIVPKRVDFLEHRGVIERLRTGEQRGRLERAGRTVWSHNHPKKMVWVNGEENVGVDKRVVCLESVRSALDPTPRRQPSGIYGSAPFGERVGDEAPIHPGALLRAVLIDPGDVAERRVHCGKVVVLNKIFDEDFPVALGLVVGLVHRGDHPTSFHCRDVGFKCVEDVSEPGFQQGGLATDVCKDQPEGSVSSDWVQPHLLFVKVFDVVSSKFLAVFFWDGPTLLVCVKRWCPHQPSVERVPPPMVWAEDGLAVSARLAYELGSTVTAHVMEASDCPSIVGEDDRA